MIAIIQAFGEGFARGMGNGLAMLLCAAAGLLLYRVTKRANV